jgi:beta-xylosidase
MPQLMSTAADSAWGDLAVLFYQDTNEDHRDWIQRCKELVHILLINFSQRLCSCSYYWIWTRPEKSLGKQEVDAHTWPATCSHHNSFMVGGWTKLGRQS